MKHWSDLQNVQSLSQAVVERVELSRPIIYNLQRKNSKITFICFYVELFMFVIICLMSHRFDVCNCEGHHGVLPECVEVQCVVSVLQVKQYFTELNTHL